MKRILIMILLGLLIPVVHSQENAYSLTQCYQLALANHPLSAQNALFEKSSQIQLKIYDKNNLPQFSLNGQVTYQSAVTELPIKIPSVTIPEIHKDQFKVTLDANQVIYGGGAVDNQKMVEKSNLEINKQGTEAELYRMRERINQIYFGILLTNYTIEVLQLNKDELNDRLHKIESGVRNGTVLPFNTAIIQAEILKVEQKQVETNSLKASLLATLGVLTGTSFPISSTFAEPSFNIELIQYRNTRPEYKLFSLQQEKVIALKSLTGTRNNPRVFAFADAGYGRPGLNMFKENADLFYMVGAKATWNFWNWHQTRQEILLYDINNQVIENQKKAFDQNTKASLQQYIADISKTEELLKTDDKIVSLRIEITAAASSQLENGVITATEYLTEYNAEIQSRLLKNLHRIQLLQAKAGYLAATGIL